MTDSNWSDKQPAEWLGDPVGTPPPASNSPAGAPNSSLPPTSPSPAPETEKQLIARVPQKFSGLFSSTWELTIAGRRPLLAQGALATILGTILGAAFFTFSVSAGWLDQKVIDAIGGKVPAYLQEPELNLTDAQIVETIQLLGSVVLLVLVMSVVIVGFVQFIGFTNAVRATSALASSSHKARPAINWGQMFGAWVLQNFAPLLPLLPGIVLLVFGMSDPLSDTGLGALLFGFLAILVGAPLSVFFYTALISMPAVAYNEKISGLKLIKRTMWLTKGSRLKFLALSVLYVVLASMIPNTLVQVLDVLVTDPLSLTGIVVLTLSSTLPLLLTIPFTSSATTVMYANQIALKDIEAAKAFFE
jgi:hypothetical protein